MGMNHKETKNTKKERQSVRKPGFVCFVSSRQPQAFLV
jgi:hypothetical protein